MAAMTAKPHAMPQGQPVRTEQGMVTRVGKLPRGYGAMRDVPLDIDPRIDLTKPIYEQVLALEQADEAAAEAK